MTRDGVVYGLVAYATWGLAPIYYKALATVPALEILAHRVVWSVVILVLWMFRRGYWREAFASLKHRQTHFTLIATMALIATNWYLFIWAVEHGQVLQASLGYYINPLVSILLGMVFLRERLSRRGVVAVLLAGIAVAFRTLEGTGFPFIALSLAFLFGVYGLLRKVVKINSVTGLTVETGMLFPLALGYLVLLGHRGSGHFAVGSWTITAILACAGFVTVLPLIWFTKAARRLPLSTIGFLQYVAPSLHFLLAVAAYGEPFAVRNAITFGCIWVALGIYSVDLLLSHRRRNEVT